MINEIIAERDLLIQQKQELLAENERLKEEVLSHKTLYRSMKSKAENLIDKIESFNGIDTTDKAAIELAFTDLFCEQDNVQDFIDYWEEKEAQ